MTLETSPAYKVSNTPGRADAIKTWYALSTTSRAEKKLYSRLQQAGVDAYLPLLPSVRQWKDRKKYVELPLFPSYLFVHISSPEYYKVLNNPGAVRFVCFNGKAVPIPEKQIEAIRFFLQHRIPLEVSANKFQQGTKVRIKEGLLAGLEAEVTDCPNKEAVIIRIDAIRLNMIVHIPVSFLEIMPS